jgi:hypothetical protein
MAFTGAQLSDANQRLARLGPEEVRKVEAAWPELLEQVASEMEKGTDPSSKDAKALADRWYALLDAFTGGDEAVKKALTDMYKSGKSRTLDHGTGPSPEMIEYISKARAAK